MASGSGHAQRKWHSVASWPESTVRQVRISDLLFPRPAEAPVDQVRRKDTWGKTGFAGLLGSDSREFLDCMQPSALKAEPSRHLS